MNHKIKTLIFKVLEKLPRRLGDRAYHALQQFNAKTIPNEFAFQQATINQFVSEMTRHNLSFKDRSIVEIGSGWLPVLPYEVLFRYQARRVLTFDINEHYQSAALGEFNAFSQEQYPHAPIRGRTLAEAVQYFPNQNIIDYPLEPASIDAVATRNVLEHITPADLESIHRQAHRYLTSDGFIIHQISPSDHRAYTDKSLSLWDFLKYSQAEWEKIQTRFDYHNRLRLPDYVNLFERCGFNILSLSFRSARQGQQLPARIHPDFQVYSEEELTAGSIIVILVPRKK